VSGGTEVRFVHSDSFPDALERSGCSLLVSTYQAGQLVTVGARDGRVEVDFRHFDRAMGVAVGADSVVVGTDRAVWHLRDHPEVAASGEVADRCFLPRNAQVTGPVQGHEMAWGTGADGEPELWVVNTLFSCLATLDDRHSFVPRWRPPFVSALAPEDRCHLNGLAMRDGVPSAVTVLARSDQPAGWRRAPGAAGAVLDVASGEVLSDGLVMPHSPRWHRDRLLVLNSGTGRVEVLDPAGTSRETVALLPGFARGLAVHAGTAFVGLSKVRETATFGGVPIAQYHDELRCGVGVVDLGSGRTVATFEFLTGVEEIFDVQVVPGARRVALRGPGDVDDPWVLPGPM
jgi:uncharacterized protein (TIGR03032 family)